MMDRVRIEIHPTAWREIKKIASVEYPGSEDIPVAGRYRGNDVRPELLERTGDDVLWGLLNQVHCARSTAPADTIMPIAIARQIQRPVTVRIYYVQRNRDSNPISARI